MERFKDWLVYLMFEPSVLKPLGSFLTALSFAALSLGARAVMVEHRIARAYSRAQILTDGKAVLPTPPGLFEQLPVINAMIPETPVGFFICVTLFVVGLSMVSFGKQIERRY